MTAILAAPRRRRAFAAWFKDLRLWSVGSFHRTEWSWPTEYIHPLSTALVRREEEADHTGAGKPPLITLHFDGTVVLRTGDHSTFKGRLFSAYAGDVVYSKIDVRNGAIGVIPPEMTVVAVSSEYPVYVVNEQIALSSYIKLVFRSRHFRRAINSLISGTSGRKRVQPDQIQALEIPLPPLSVQREIVDRWKTTQKRTTAIQKRLDEVKREVEARFFKDLGLTPPEEVARTKCFGVTWKDLERWSVSYNQAVRSGSDLLPGRYRTVALGLILESIQYGTSEKANTNGEGLPVLRMNNIVDGTLDTRDLKYVVLRDRERTLLLLRDGDILINRTNSKELVGKCAVFHEAGAFVFASYLIRLRPRCDVALADFVVFLLNSPVGRSQIDALSRQIIGQANINTEEIRSLQIPLPPLSAQTSIMRRVKRELALIRRESEKEHQLEASAEQEIEKIVLGVQPVSGN